MKLTEKIAYMKGYMEGLELDKATKESKVIAMMADVIEDMGAYIDDLQDELGSFRNRAFGKRLEREGQGVGNRLRHAADPEVDGQHAQRARISSRSVHRIENAGDYAHLMHAR